MLDIHFSKLAYPIQCIYYYWYVHCQKDRAEQFCRTRLNSLLLQVLYLKFVWVLIFGSVSLHAKSLEARTSMQAWRGGQKFYHWTHSIQELVELLQVPKSQSVSRSLQGREVQSWKLDLWPAVIQCIWVKFTRLYPSHTQIDVMIPSYCFSSNQ